MRRYIYIIGVTVLFLASCGKQHQAEKLIESFMTQNLSNPKAVTDVHYNKLDSTRIVGDSLVMVMRQNLKQASHYKADVSYADGGATRPLMITRVIYKLDGEEVQDTYYLDQQLTRIVAVKTN